MKDLQKNQLTDLRDNIKEMRQIMDTGSPAIRFIYSARNIRPVFLATGIWAAVFSLLYHALLMIYQSGKSIPGFLITGYYTLLIMTWICILVLRTIISLKAGRKLDKNMNFRGLLKSLLYTRLMLIVFPVLAVFIILPFKMIDYLLLTDVLPYIAIVLGSILNILGITIRNIEYNLTGYWLICAGIMGLFFIVLPVHIAFGAIFAPGCFLFFIAAYLNEKKV